MNAQDVLAKALWAPDWSDDWDAADDVLKADYRSCAIAGLQALAAAGYAVVPVEPTEEMEVQGGLTRDFDAVKMPSRQRAVLTWKAMIAAAPKP